MSEQPAATPASAASQLKQLANEKVRQGVSAAKSLTGQQAGSLAQAVRQAGEEMRQQGQENRGKVADKVAQPVQRWSGTLSEFDAQQVTLDVKQVKPKVGQQAQRLKTQAGEQISKQVDARAAQAGQGVTALTQAGRQTTAQLRAQGQRVPALVLDAVLEKVEPLAGYLGNADAGRLRSDVAVYRRQATTKLSAAGEAVTGKQQAATAKGAEGCQAGCLPCQASPLTADRQRARGSRPRRSARFEGGSITNRSRTD